MKRDALLRMSAEQIDAYARVLGIDTTTRKTKEAKADLIDEARQRVAEVDLLGETVSVPIRAMHDQTIVDRIVSAKTERQGRALLRDILGDEQWERVLAAATDEDGAVDSDAVNFAYVSLVRSPQLKNFAPSPRRKGGKESD